MKKEIKKAKKEIKKIAKKVSRDPLMKEFINEEKKVAKRVIGKTAKRAKDNIETK